jgi:D-glycero-alpha-D-manno-heptose-7-phosphate kinase
MMRSLQKALQKKTVFASAPCRVDMGGTLDLATFYLPLRHAAPCTFNLAVDLRTVVRLRPYRRGRLKISSRGFETAEFPSKRIPFDHPLGLISAVAAYFDADGIQIAIESSSPVRSALGGSSAAAVALIAAFFCAAEIRKLTPRLRKEMALLAHAVEESVAAVPCGRQDQLAAAFGGVHAWHWNPTPQGLRIEREALIKRNQGIEFQRHFLLAYCGVPHASKDINGRWVRQFLSGKNRTEWLEIARCTKKFIDALKRCNYKEAAKAMRRETAVRLELTPDVLDEVGRELVAAAGRCGCGARFTGAGGGGCLWALGPGEDIARLKPAWQAVLGGKKTADLLAAEIDFKGVEAGWADAE